MAESLDPDVLPDYDNTAGHLQYPTERPWGVEQCGVTSAEARVGEPLEERIRREVKGEFADIGDPDDITLAGTETEGLAPSHDIDVDLIASVSAEPVLPGDRSTLDDERDY